MLDFSSNDAYLELFSIVFICLLKIMSCSDSPRYRFMRVNLVFSAMFKAFATVCRSSEPDGERLGCFTTVCFPSLLVPSGTLDMSKPISLFLLSSQLYLSSLSTSSMPLRLFYSFFDAIFLALVPASCGRSWSSFTISSSGTKFSLF